MTRAVLLLITGSLCLGCLERRADDTSPEQEACTPCHGGLLDPPNHAAPPFSLAGETDPSAPGVGAHEAHLVPTGRARPLDCNECHVVPEAIDAVGHIDDDYPAEVRFQGVALSFDAEPSFDHETGACSDTYCHGGQFIGRRPSGGTDTEPTWTSQSESVASCTGCHGMPPPLPHPEVDDCEECHKNVRADETFSHPLLHVDGDLTFFIPEDR